MLAAWGQLSRRIAAGGVFQAFQTPTCPHALGPPLSEGPLRLCGRDPASRMLTDTQLDDRQPTLEGLP